MKSVRNHLCAGLLVIALSASLTLAQEPKSDLDKAPQPATQKDKPAERPYFVEQLTEKIPFYSQRHLVEPGLTGWAQVNYGYGASVEDALQKLQYDLYYIKNVSLLFDIWIIFKSIKIVLFGYGR